MASSLFLLLDDIATVLDDVSLLTKVAAKKTAGVLGDDLALNAEQVSGVRASRELPVVWAVAKGSALNKLILVPMALLVSSIAPWLVTPLLMLGGAYLCFEGVEKLIHSLQKLRAKGGEPAEAVAKAQPEQQDEQLRQALLDPSADFLKLEHEKIKGAIRTDFILSAEIIVISLGAVGEADFVTRLGVLTLVAALMTVGVYGLVAAIVRLDDAGMALLEKNSAFLQHIGESILALAPVLMKALAIAGTIAMFLVGGGIISHGIPVLEHGIEALTAGMVQPWISLSGMGLHAVIGIALGLVCFALVSAYTTIRSKLAGS